MQTRKRDMSRRERRKATPQNGYTQLLQGSRLSTARSVRVDMHAKHCFEVCRAVKGMQAGAAIAYLNEVLKVDSDRADIRKKARAIPYRLGSGNKRRLPVRTFNGWSPKGRYGPRTIPGQSVKRNHQTHRECNEQRFTSIRRH